MLAILWLTALNLVPGLATNEPNPLPELPPDFPYQVELSVLRQVIIDLNGKPIFVQQPDPVYYLKGKSVELKCAALRASQINFYCNNKHWGYHSQSNSERLDPRDSRVKYLESSIRVKKSVVMQFLGKFTCECVVWGKSQDQTTNNPYKVHSSPAVIRDAYLGKQFLGSPIPEVVMVGSKQVKLDCTPPDGVPTPDVYWLKNGQPLLRPKNTTSSNFLVTNRKSLVFSEVTLADSGNYSCAATNIVGTRYSDPALLLVIVGGDWSAWSQWSSCLGPCEMPARSRQRHCLTVNNSCIGNSFQRQVCSDHCGHTGVPLRTLEDFALDGFYWSEWSDWSLCNTTCKRHRSRSCLATTSNEPIPESSSCFGLSLQVDTCNAAECVLGTGSIHENRLNFAVTTTRSFFQSNEESGISNVNVIVISGIVSLTVLICVILIVVIARHGLNKRYPPSSSLSTQVDGQKCVPGPYHELFYQRNDVGPDLIQNRTMFTRLPGGTTSPLLTQPLTTSTQLDVGRTSNLMYPRVIENPVAEGNMTCPDYMPPALVEFSHECPTLDGSTLSNDATTSGTGAGAMTPSGSWFFDASPSREASSLPAEERSCSIDDAFCADDEPTSSEPSPYSGDPLLADSGLDNVAYRTVQSHSSGCGMSQTLSGGSASSESTESISPLIATLPSELVPNFDRSIACGTFTSEGGRLSLPRTGVSLLIPPGAIESDGAQILYLSVLCDDDGGLSSNEQVLLSSVVVCGSPTPCRLLKPFVLSMPHCMAGGQQSRTGDWTLFLNSCDIQPSPLSNDATASLTTNGNLVWSSQQLGCENLNTPHYCHITDRRVYVMTEMLGCFALSGQQQPLDSNSAGNGLLMAVSERNEFAAKRLKIAAFLPENWASFNEFAIKIFILTNRTDDVLVQVVDSEREQMTRMQLCDECELSFDACPHSGDLHIRLANVQSGWQPKVTDWATIPHSHVWQSNGSNLHCTISMKRMDGCTPLSPTFTCQLIASQQPHGCGEEQIMSVTSMASGTSSCIEDIGSLLPLSASDGPDSLQICADKFLVDKLCRLLDPPNSKATDWRILAQHLRVVHFINYFASKPRPTETLLTLWESLQEPLETLAKSNGIRRRPDVFQMLNSLLK